MMDHSNIILEITALRRRLLKILLSLASRTPALPRLLLSLSLSLSAPGSPQSCQGPSPLGSWAHASPEWQRLLWILRPQLLGQCDNLIQEVSAMSYVLF